MTYNYIIFSSSSQVIYNRYGKIHYKCKIMDSIRYASKSMQGFGCTLQVEIVTLTYNQIKEYGLSSNPTKKTGLRKHCKKCDSEFLDLGASALKMSAGIQGLTYCNALTRACTTESRVKSKNRETHLKWPLQE